MREITIVPRQGLEIGMELFKSIGCLRSAGINPRSAVVRKGCVVLWVDNEEISIALDLLKNNGFEAAYVTETDEPL